MFSIRAETTQRPNIPFTPAQYSMHSAEACYVTREKLIGKKYVPAETLEDDDCIRGPYRVRVEVHPGGAKDPFMIYVGVDEMHDRIFVMNDAGKTVDTIC